MAFQTKFDMMLIETFLDPTQPYWTYGTFASNQWAWQDTNAAIDPSLIDTQTYHAPIAVQRLALANGTLTQADYRTPYYFACYFP